MQIGGRDGDALRVRRLRFEMQGGGVTGWRLELQAQSCRVARGRAWTRRDGRWAVHHPD